MMVEWMKSEVNWSIFITSTPTSLQLQFGYQSHELIESQLIICFNWFLSVSGQMRSRTTNFTAHTAHSNLSIHPEWWFQVWLCHPQPSTCPQHTALSSSLSTPTILVISFKGLLDHQHHSVKPSRCLYELKSDTQHHRTFFFLGDDDFKDTLNSILINSRFEKKED